MPARLGQPFDTLTLSHTSPTIGTHAHTLHTHIPAVCLHTHSKHSSVAMKLTMQTKYTDVTWAFAHLSHSLVRQKYMVPTGAECMHNYTPPGKHASQMPTGQSHSFIIFLSFVPSLLCSFHKHKLSVCSLPGTGQDAKFSSMINKCSHSCLQGSHCPMGQVRKVHTRSLGMNTGNELAKMKFWSAKRSQQQANLEGRAIAE